MPHEKRPPLGLKPKNIHDQHRAIEILSAIDRYLRDMNPVPREWFDELEQLLYPKNEQ